MGVVLAQNHPSVSAFSDSTFGSACTSTFSRFAQRLLALRPAHSRGHQSRDRYPGASDISSPPCLPRLLPAGAIAGRGLHPLDKRRLVTARVGIQPFADQRPSVVALNDQRGTCEQFIKEGKGAVKWTRLSCRTPRRQCRPPPAPRPRVQPWQFHADNGAAQAGGTVVADQPAREADQDRITCLASCCAARAPRSCSSTDIQSQGKSGYAVLS